MDYKLKESVDDLMAAMQKNQENFGIDDSLTEKFKELQAALEASEYAKPKTDITYGGGLRVNDLLLQADEKGFLTVAAKKAMGKKSTSLIAKFDDGRFYRCIYLMACVRTDQTELALKEICSQVNDLVKDGLVHSTLCPPSSIELARMPGNHPSCAVFCYVLVPGDEVESIEKRMKYIAQEGGCGPTIGSLQVELPIGEFFAVARIGYQFGILVQNNYDVSGQLFEMIQEYLRVLPRGTKFLGATKCAVTDLSVPYELRFYNPLLQRVKMVELTHVRDRAVLADKLEQFNLFLGVTYFGADGNKLHQPYV